MPAGRRWRKGLVGVFGLGQRLRVGLELRAFVDGGEFNASWPDAEWNMRVDWLGAER